jgi:hypothetical protein
VINAQTGHVKLRLLAGGGLTNGVEDGVLYRAPCCLGVPSGVDFSKHFFAVRVARDDAHFLITGLHGGTGALETVADITEIVVNAAFWAFLTRGASRLGRNSRNSN